MRATGLRASVACLLVVSVGVLVVYPLVRMARTVWLEGGSDVLGRPGLGEAVRHSIVLALAVTAIAVPIGTALALALRRPGLPARRFWQLAVLLPVLVPDFVLGYSWLRSYGRGGFTDDLLGVAWTGVQGPVGVVVVVAVNAVPIAYLVTAVGLAARAEPAAERAARMSGARPWTVLRTITLPLLRPAIGAAAVLTFVLAMGSFAIPQVMGSPAGFTTVTTRIYSDLTRSSAPALFVEAVALSLLLVVLTVVVVVPADSVLASRLRSTRVAVADPAGGAAVRRGPRARVTAAVIGGYLILTVGVPLLALVATALTRAAGLAPTPSNWTLDNFSVALDTRTLEALGRSVALAAIAATVLLVLGGSVAALERRPYGRALTGLVTLTLVLPGSTLAVGLLIAYGRWIGGTLALIVLAYVAKLWAFAHRPVSGALDRLPPDELRAARVSGASPLVSLRTVVLRPLAPALLAAWTVCFLTALHEVTMSSLLYGPGSETLAVVVLNSQELGRVGVTSALCVALTLVLVVPAAGFWLAARWLRRAIRAPGKELDRVG